MHTGKGVERRGFSYAAGGGMNWHNHYGERVEVPLKTEKSITTLSSNPTPVHIPSENHSFEKVHAPTSVFTAAQFIIVETLKQMKYPSTEE